MSQIRKKALDNQVQIPRQCKEVDECHQEHMNAPSQTRTKV